MSPFAIFVRVMIVVIMVFAILGIGFNIFSAIRKIKKGISQFHARSYKFEMFTPPILSSASAMGSVQQQYFSPDDKRFQNQTPDEYQHQQVSPGDMRFNALRTKKMEWPMGHSIFILLKRVAILLHHVIYSLVGKRVGEIFSTT